MIIPKNKLDLNDVYFSKTKKELNKQRVSTTLAKQLALYVVIYSPLQMASDFIENYKEIPAFNFIKDVPVDWDSTLALNGEVGEYVTIARKDSKSKDWYLGSITNQDKRSFEIELNFLDKGTYKAVIYKDTEFSDWDLNPTEYFIENKFYSKGHTHLVNLAKGCLLYTSDAADE